MSVSFTLLTFPFSVSCSSVSVWLCLFLSLPQHCLSVSPVLTCVSAFSLYLCVSLPLSLLPICFFHTISFSVSVILSLFLSLCVFLLMSLFLCLSVSLSLWVFFSLSLHVSLSVCLYICCLCLSDSVFQSLFLSLSLSHTHTHTEYSHAKWYCKNIMLIVGLFLLVCLFRSYFILKGQRIEIYRVKYSNKNSLRMSIVLISEVSIKLRWLFSNWLHI